MKNVLFALLFFCAIGHSLAASKVSLVIQLLEQDLITDACMDRDELIAWIGAVNADITSYLEKTEGNHDLLFQFTIHPDAEVTIQQGMRSAFNDTLASGLLSALSKHTSMRTDRAHYSYIVYATVNEGKKGEYVPVVLTPQKQRAADFKALDLVGKKEAIQNWTRSQIIPIVAYYENKVSSVFKGVLAVGEMMTSESFMNTDVNELTFKNHMYWRGCMEMEQANLLIPFSKACMHLAKGEFDQAERLLFIIRLFSDKSTLAMIYYSEITEKLAAYNEVLNAEISKGLALHDAGNYAGAIAHYEELLKKAPNSAWLNYELYFSQSAAGDINDMGTAWAAAKPTVYRCDPMYSMDVHASTGKEAWLIFRRQEIGSLFSSRDQLIPDFINYADIALDLENYGFAAQLYWLIFSQVEKKNHEGRNMLAYYLFCLDRLGDKESIKNFEGDFPAEFEKITKARQKVMEKSSIYKAMEG